VPLFQYTNRDSSSTTLHAYPNCIQIQESAPRCQSPAPFCDAWVVGACAVTCHNPRIHDQSKPPALCRQNHEFLTTPDAARPKLRHDHSHEHMHPNGSGSTSILPSPVQEAPESFRIAAADCPGGGAPKKKNQKKSCDGFRGA
jgi:hypothetical protein